MWSYSPERGTDAFAGGFAAAAFSALPIRIWLKQSCSRTGPRVAAVLIFSLRAPGGLCVIESASRLRVGFRWEGITIGMESERRMKNFENEFRTQNAEFRMKKHSCVSWLRAGFLHDCCQDCDELIGFFDERVDSIYRNELRVREDAANNEPHVLL